MREEVTVVSIEIGGNRRMIFNIKILRWMVGFMIFMAFTSQFISEKASAQEHLFIEDGNYQVELSFSSLEGEQQESIFSKEATLVVKNGLYQLTLTTNNPKTIKHVQIQQFGKEWSATLNHTENLVQFDIEEGTSPFKINGLFLLPDEENAVSFTEHLTILFDSLTENAIDVEEETEVEQSKREWTLDYLLLEDGQNKPSIMNTYVNPTAKIIEIAGNYTVQLTILKPHWVTRITMEQDGEQLEPTIISHVEDKKVLQFDIKEIKTLQRLYVQVDIPELAYHHQYFVNLQFNQEQIADYFGEVLKIENPAQPEIEEHSQGATPAKITAPVQEINTPARQSIPINKPILTLPEEPRLAFNRTLDEEIDAITEEAQHEQVIEDTVESMLMKDDSKSKLGRLDLLKILFLFSICLLSGFMFVRRLKKAKPKNSTD